MSQFDARLKDDRDVQNMIGQHCAKCSQKLTGLNVSKYDWLCVACVLQGFWTERDENGNVVLRHADHDKVVEAGFVSAQDIKQFLEANGIKPDDKMVNSCTIKITGDPTFLDDAPCLHENPCVCPPQRATSLDKSTRELTKEDKKREFWEGAVVNPATEFTPALPIPHPDVKVDKQLEFEEERQKFNKTLTDHVLPEAFWDNQGKLVDEMQSTRGECISHGPSEETKRRMGHPESFPVHTCGFEKYRNFKQPGRKDTYQITVSYYNQLMKAFEGQGWNYHEGCPGCDAESAFINQFSQFVHPSMLPQRPTGVAAADAMSKAVSEIASNTAKQALSDVPIYLQRGKGEGEVDPSVERMFAKPKELPNDIRYSVEHDNFYHKETNEGQGQDFYARYRHLIPELISHARYLELIEKEKKIQELQDKIAKESSYVEKLEVVRKELQHRVNFLEQNETVVWEVLRIADGSTIHDVASAIYQLRADIDAATACIDAAEGREAKLEETIKRIGLNYNSLHEQLRIAKVMLEEQQSQKIEENAEPMQIEQGVTFDIDSQALALSMLGKQILFVSQGIPIVGEVVAVSAISPSRLNLTLRIDSDVYKLTNMSAFARRL